LSVDLGSTSFKGCFATLGATSQTEGPALVNVASIYLLHNLRFQGRKEIIRITNFEGVLVKKESLRVEDASRTKTTNVTV
jgi:hypothetical protein